MIGSKAKNFGSEVKKRRLQKGMTQEQLALKIDRDSSYVSKIENGQLDPKQGPSEIVVHALAENLLMEGESVEYLFYFFWTILLDKLSKSDQEIVVKMLKNELTSESQVVHNLARIRKERSISPYDQLKAIKH